MRLPSCAECGCRDINDITNSIEFNNRGNLHLIENIRAFQCSQCKEIYYSPEGSRYIDRQIELIRDKH